MASAAIELRLGELRQLFNSLDPTPFRQQDLDADAEAYIVETAEELPADAALRLVLHVPAAEAAEADATAVADAVRHYFAYRLDVAGHELRQLLRTGRLALAIGVGFLAVCSLLSALAAERVPGDLGAVIAEGLVIIGWVALWRPVEIFLYDWWPILRRRRLLARLAVMPVELRAEPEAQSAR
jgi:hypothetical protein